MNKKLLIIIVLLATLTLAAAPSAEREDISAGGAITGIFAVLFVAMCILALPLVTAALLPGLHQRSVEALACSPWRALGLGLLNLVFFGVLFAVCANLPVLGLISLFIALALPSLTVVGLAALGRLVGERLTAWRDESTSPLTRLVAGNILLALALFSPFIGWFVLLPLASLAGLGAVVMALFQRQAQAVEAEA